LWVYDPKCIHELMIWEPPLQLSTNKSHAVVHWAFTTLIVTSKPSRVIAKWKPIRGSTKWTRWDYPIMQKLKCFIPSFKSITQSWAILQDVFATTSVNSWKFLGWKEVLKSLYILYKSPWQSFENYNVITHKNISALCKFYQTFIDSNMGKIHGKSRIMWISHKFSKLALADSTLTLSIAILAMNIFYYFSTHFKGCNILIHLVFTLCKTFSPLVFTILTSLVNSRWCFWEVEKYL